MTDTISADRLCFDGVRRMSASALNKLTKHQLLHVLRDAIDKADDCQSGQSAINADVIKSAVTDAVNEIKVELMSESKRMIENVERRLEREINMITTSLENDVETRIIDELELRESKRNNVVIFGVPESMNSDIDRSREHDNNQLNDLLSTLNLDHQVEMTRSFRLGKKGTRARPIKVILNSPTSKSLLFKSAPRLSKLSDNHQFKRVYIKNDLTLRQREQDSFLRLELKRRRDNGEDACIRKGKIVLRSL